MAATEAQGLQGLWLHEAQEALATANELMVPIEFLLIGRLDRDTMRPFCNEAYFQ